MAADKGAIESASLSNTDAFNGGERKEEDMGMAHNKCMQTEGAEEIELEAAGGAPQHVEAPSENVNLINENSPNRIDGAPVELDSVDTLK